MALDLARTRRGIDSFWSAWPSLRADLDVAVANGDTERIAELLQPRVDAIDSRLAWETSKGTVAETALVLSAEGSRELRSTTERWLRAAPAPDERWEFHPSRQPDPDALGYTLQLDGATLDLSETLVGFATDADRALVDVAVHHPLLAQLEDGSRTTFAFLVLDWLLGEDGVERFVGEVEAAPERPDGAAPPEELRAAVDGLARAADPGWVLLEAEADDGSPVIAVALARLNPLDHPLFDLHVETRLPYAEENEGRLPVGASAKALEAFEDELERALGGDGLVVAHDAVAGVRTIHAYADAESDAAARAEEHARAWPEGDAVVSAELDPAWEAVAHLRA